jgi:hypothetical protein
VLYGYNLWVESFYGGSDILSYAIRNLLRSSDDDFQQQTAKTYRDIDVATDKKVFLALLKNYVAHVPDSTFLPKGVMHEIGS